MFNRKPNINETALRMQIDRLFTRLDKITPEEIGNEEYAVVSARLQELYKLRETDSNVNSKKRESHAAWGAIAANVAVVVTIVGYEQKAVITSKAMSFVQKLR